MPTREHIVGVIEAYCRCETEKDKQGWLALFAPEATHEDPVGKLTNAGIKNIAAFWDSFQPVNVELWLTEPPIVCGNEAIAFMKCRVGPANDRHESGRIIDQFIFNDEGKIVALRAFYEAE